MWESRRGDERKAGDVKPELVFDVCWEVYRGAREVLEAKQGISALKPEKAGKFLWRPDVKARLNEWVASSHATERPDRRGGGVCLVQSRGRGC